MFTRIRSVLSGSLSDSNNKSSSSHTSKGPLSPKFPYSRPHFLAMSEEQVHTSADHKTRPIITPNHGMSFFTGYAECINAGKSKWNEDQAVFQHGALKSGNFIMPYKFFGLFDGHAGVGASICAANQMHHVVHERLVDTQDDIWADFVDNEDPQKRNLLITGALEAAFKDMDDIIKDDRIALHSSGGCTAIVAISLLGQLYVANAGDSRAIVCKGYGFQCLSNDFTPESDKKRIRQLAQAKPELLGNDFTYMEYSRQPRINDLGKRILYRDAFMTGWAHKTIAPDDLKIPVISGHGKRSRVMGTIGVTRGFGDHELLSVHQKVPIKPLLSCHPEVKVYNLAKCNTYDVLIMGTDGLWDVVDGHTVTQIVNYAVENFPRKEMCSTAAACLVGAARGSLREHCWMMKSGKPASVDDISVFVVPLYPCSRTTYKLRKHLQSDEENDYTVTNDDFKGVILEDDLPSPIIPLNDSGQPLLESRSFSSSLNRVEEIFALKSSRYETVLPQRCDEEQVKTENAEAEKIILTLNSPHEDVLISQNNEQDKTVNSNIDSTVLCEDNTFMDINLTLATSFPVITDDVKQQTQCYKFFNSEDACEISRQKFEPKDITSEVDLPKSCVNLQMEAQCVSDRKSAGMEKENDREEKTHTSNDNRCHLKIGLNAEQINMAGTSLSSTDERLRFSIYAPLSQAEAILKHNSDENIYLNKHHSYHSNNSLDFTVRKHKETKSIIPDTEETFAHFLNIKNHLSLSDPTDISRTRRTKDVRGTRLSQCKHETGDIETAETGMSACKLLPSPTLKIERRRSNSYPPSETFKLATPISTEFATCFNHHFPKLVEHPEAITVNNENIEKPDIFHSVEKDSHRNCASTRDCDLIATLNLPKGKYKSRGDHKFIQ